MEHVKITTFETTKAPNVAKPSNGTQDKKIQRSIANVLNKWIGLGNITEAQQVDAGLDPVQVERDKILRAPLIR